jgi:hypothetical protein
MDGTSLLLCHLKKGVAQALDQRVVSRALRATELKNDNFDRAKYPA